MIQVDEKDRDYLTIAKHVGYYRYRRLCFGLKTASAKFQAYMETLLEGIPGVSVLLDDIPVIGQNKDVHFMRLKEVFFCYKPPGVRIKLEKCQFQKHSVRYMGHRIDREQTDTGASP